MRRSIVQVHLAKERVLCIVKVPALGLNRSSGFAGVFFLPLGNNMVVGLNFEQAL